VEWISVRICGEYGKMKIAIIEDEQVHIDLLKEYLVAWSGKRGVSVEIKEFLDAESFLFQWEDERVFDVLFIDIQMKEMNGMELARKIREVDRDMVLIFTTGIADYIQDGYEVEALHYLLKPIRREKVEECLDKAEKRRRREEFFLVHPAVDEVRKMNVEMVNYVEARGHGSVLGLVAANRVKEDFCKEPVLQTRKKEDFCNKTVLKTEKKENLYVELAVMESISELEKVLSEFHFIKCHRSYLCRIGGIHHIDKKEIFFDNGSHIPVSRRMYGEVNQKFIRYFRKD
jgi:DNA-binding LytR/AlgR family response regulator